VQSSSDSKQDVVKVSYTSAQDLAEALFPTGAPANTDIDAQLERHSAHIDDLSEHRELVHEALLDHRDKVQQLHAPVEAEPGSECAKARAARRICRWLLFYSQPNSRTI
jgi:hypothetical protein